MLNKDGGVEADITVSVLENGDSSSVIKPKFEGTVSSVILISEKKEFFIVLVSRQHLRVLYKAHKY